MQSFRSITQRCLSQTSSEIMEQQLECELNVVFDDTVGVYDRVRCVRGALPGSLDRRRGVPELSALLVDLVGFGVLRRMLVSSELLFERGPGPRLTFSGGVVRLRWSAPSSSTIVVDHFCQPSLHLLAILCAQVGSRTGTSGCDATRARGGKKGYALVVIAFVLGRKPHAHDEWRRRDRAGIRGRRTSPLPGRRGIAKDPTGDWIAAAGESRTEREAVTNGEVACVIRGVGLRWRQKCTGKISRFWKMSCVVARYGPRPLLGPRMAES